MELLADAFQPVLAWTIWESVSTLEDLIIFGFRIFNMLRLLNKIL